MTETIENIVNSVFRGGKQHPQKTAVLCENSQLNYGQLCGKVWALAQKLKAAGLVEGQLVATYLPRSVELVVAMLAILAARGVFMPLGFKVAPAKNRQKLNAAKATLIITQGPQDLAVEGQVAIDITELPGSPPAQWQTLAPFTPDDVAYVLFTSGTTGTPKGVMVTHQALLNHMRWKNQTYPVSPGATEIQKVPLSFDVSIRELFGWIRPGNTLVIVPEGQETHPSTLCDTIEQHRCEELSMVPSLLDAFISYVKAFNLTHQLSSLKRVLVGGEVLTAATVNNFKQLFGAMNIKLINLYGPAEATIEITAYDCDEHPFDIKDTVPIGKALYPDSLSIRDKCGQAVALGEIGELHILGPQVSVGYINNKNHTEKAYYFDTLSNKKAYKTGDLVHQDSQGYLYFHGRIDSQIKINGHRVELEEIRQAFAPLIDPSMVMITSHKTDKGYDIGAYIHRQALPKGVYHQTLTQHLKQFLEDYLIPRNIQLVSQFPHSDAGKVDIPGLPDFICPWPLSVPLADDVPIPGIVERFESLAAHQPDKIAIYGHDKQISYAQLNAKANRIGRFLQTEFGLGKDDVVAILMPTSIDWIAAMLAILKCGAGYLPLSVSAPDERNQYCLDDTQTKVLVTDKGHSGKLQGAQVCLSEVRYQNYSSKNLGLNRAPDSLLQILYTSGSTGKPKGVMLEDLGLHGRLDNKQKLNPLTPQQSTLLNTATTFDVASWELFGWIYGKGSLCLLPPGLEADPQSICQAVQQHNVGELHFAPSMLHAFLQYVDEYELAGSLKGLNNIRSAGDVLRPDTVVLFHQLLHQPFGVTLLNSYGPSEATIEICQWSVDTSKKYQQVPIGRVHPGISLYILDQQYKPCPQGIKGQFAISGLGLARGYCNNPDKTNTSFIDDPFLPGNKLYLSGDIGYQDEQGVLHFCARLDHQVKIHGHRIEPGEIEHAFYRFLPSNKVVVNPELVGREKKLIAYIEKQALEQSAMEDSESLRQALSKILPHYLIPATIHVVAEIPLNQNGKINRQKLPQLVEKTSADDAPSSDDLRLLSIIKQEFDLPCLPSLNNKLSDFGADSINIIHLVSELKAQLNWQLSMEHVMPHNSIAQLKQAAQQHNLAQQDLFLTFNDRQQETLFCLPPASGYGFAYSAMAKALPQYKLIAFHFPLEVDDVAKRYGDQILAFGTNSPIRLIGYSGGGNLAVTVTQYLESRGVKVSTIIMLDAYKQYGSLEKLSEGLQSLKESMIATTIQDLTRLGLKQQSIRNRVNAYYRNHWLSNSRYKGPISADIIAINSSERDLVEQLALDSQLRGIFAPDWSDTTNGKLLTLEGSGKHNDMLTPPHLQRNIQLFATYLPPQQKQD